MAKQSRSDGGVQIPLYLNIESFEQQLSRLPQELNTRIKNISDSLETVNLRFKINTVGVVDKKAIQSETRRQLKDRADILEAGVKSITEVAPNTKFQLKAELDAKQAKQDLLDFEKSVQKTTTSVEKFSDKLKSALSLPKLDLDISKLEEKEKRIISISDNIHKSLENLKSEQTTNLKKLKNFGISVSADEGKINPDDVSAAKTVLANRKSELEEQKKVANERLEEIAKERGQDLRTIVSKRVADINRQYEPLIQANQYELDKLKKLGNDFNRMAQLSEHIGDLKKAKNGKIDSLYKIVQNGVNPLDIDESQAKKELGQIEKKINRIDRKSETLDKVLADYARIEKAILSRSKNIYSFEDILKGTTDQKNELKSERVRTYGEPTVSDKSLQQLASIEERSSKLKQEISALKTKAEELEKQKKGLEEKIKEPYYQSNKGSRNELKAQLENVESSYNQTIDKITKKQKELTNVLNESTSKLFTGSQSEVINKFTGNILRFQQVLGNLKFADLPNINDIYKYSKNAFEPIRNIWQNDIRGIIDSTQSLPTALDKAFELIGNSPSIAKATEGLTGFKKGLAGAFAVAQTGFRVFAAVGVSLLGFEKTLENFARPALEAQNALYVMSLGMHSSVDDMKQLSVITQVAGVGMNSVQVALRRVNAQLVKTSEGSKLARDTLKHYGANLFDERGNLKQGMAQLDEIAKAYQNAMAQGRGAEFRYRVGGRYWDNDFVALISDYAANKKSMNEIVKSNLADPALAYSVRGSMYALEAQQKQFQTAFASAFMPVVEHVAPQMKQRFAELTKVIEQNAPAIKSFGFAIGEIVGKISDYGTSFIEKATHFLRWLDLGHDARIAAEAVKKNSKLIQEQADKALGIERDKSGNIKVENGKVIANQSLIDLIAGNKTPKENLEAYKLKQQLTEPIGRYEKALQNRSFSNYGSAVYYSQKEKDEAEKALEEVRREWEKSGKNFDQIANKFAPYIDKETGDLDAQKVLDKIEREFTNPKEPRFFLEGIDIEAIQKNIRETAEQTVLDRLTEEFSNENLNKLNVYNNYKQTGKIRDAAKLAEVQKEIDDISEELLKATILTFHKSATEAKNLTDSEKNEKTHAYDDELDDLEKRQDKRAEEIKKLQLDIEFGNYDIARSYAEINRQYQKELDIINKAREANKLEADKEAKKAKDERLDESEKTLNEQRLEQLKPVDKKFAQEIKKYYKNAYNTIYNLSRSTVEKELSDNRLWLASEKEKIALLQDEGQKKQKLTAATTEAAAKEMQTLKQLKDELKGNVRSIEEDLFRLTRSQFDNDRREIMKKYEERVRKNPADEPDARRVAQLEIAKLLKDHANDDSYFKAQFQEPQKLKQGQIPIVYGDVGNDSNDRDFYDEAKKFFHNQSVNSAQSKTSEPRYYSPLPRPTRTFDTTPSSAVIFDDPEDFKSFLKNQESTLSEQLNNLRSQIQFQEENGTDTSSLEKQIKDTEKELVEVQQALNEIPQFEKEFEEYKNSLQLVPQDDNYSGEDSGKIKIGYSDAPEKPEINYANPEEEIIQRINDKIFDPEYLAAFKKGQDETAQKELTETAKFAEAFKQATGELANPIAEAILNSDKILEEGNGYLKNIEDALKGEGLIPQDLNLKDLDSKEEDLFSLSKDTKENLVDASKLTSALLAGLSLLPQLSPLSPMLAGGAAAFGIGAEFGDQYNKRSEDKPQPTQQPTPTGGGLVSLVQGIKNDLEKYLPVIAGENYSAKPTPTTPNESEDTIGLKNIDASLSSIKAVVSEYANKIESEIKNLVQEFGELSNKITEKLKQDIVVNSSPTINLNLSGSYVLTETMVNKLADEATTKVANGVTSAVEKGVYLALNGGGNTV